MGVGMCKWLDFFLVAVNVRLNSFRMVIIIVNCCDLEYRSLNGKCQHCHFSIHGQVLCFTS